MKYIFDFDDVIFETTRRRLEHVYPFLEERGIPVSEIDDYYKKVRGEQFSIKKLLKHFSLGEELYEEMMHGSETFANPELIELIKKMGKENCYLITYGDEDFQRDKIKILNVGSLFLEIIVVPTDEKRKLIEEICARYPDETVLFIDDKAKHFVNLDFKKYPKLRTVHWDKQHGLEKLKEEIAKNT